MKRVRFRAGTFLSAMLLALLTACGGGGSNDSSSSPPGTSAGTSLTAVDPYVVGAVFDEIDNNGNVRQTSAPTNETGQALFPEEVLPGSTLVMTSTGLHNGVPFKGMLKRKVEQAGSSFVVSPLTTLAVELGSNDAVLSVLGGAGLNLTADAFDLDPMAALEGKTDPVLEDFNLLIANLAVNAALNMVGTEDSDALASVIGEVIQRLGCDGPDEGDGADILDAMHNVQGADVADCITSFAAITDYLITEVAEAEQAGQLTPEQIAGLMEEKVNSLDIPSLVQAAATDGVVAIDSGGEIDTPSTTVRECLEAGYASFAQFDESLTSPIDPLLAAAEAFQTARILIGIDGTATQADQDEARFFGSLAELVQLAKPYSDFTDNGLNNLGDILDAFGVETDASLRSDFDTLPTDDIAPTPTTPESGEFQQALATMLLGRLGSMVDSLDQVSSDFNLKRVETSGTEYDYGDVLFLKGLAQAMHAAVNLQLAYDLNTNLYDLETVSTAEQFLTDNPAFGSLASNYATRLAAAQTKLAAAADAMLAAIDAIDAETDDQTDDLMAFYADTPEEMAADIQEFKANLAEFKESLSGPVTFDDGDDSLTLDLSRIFAGIDLRDKTPDFAGEVPGYFPDATMGGVIVNTAQLDINEDQDGDGSPDLLWGYTRFFDDWLAGRTFYWWPEGGSVNYNLTFNTSDSNFILSWTDWSVYPEVSGTVTGGYEIQPDGSLLLTNDNAPEMFTTVRATLLEPVDDDNFEVGLSIDDDPPVTTLWWSYEDYL